MRLPRSHRIRLRKQSACRYLSPRGCGVVRLLFAKRGSIALPIVFSSVPAASWTRFLTVSVLHSLLTTREGAN